MQMSMVATLLLGTPPPLPPRRFIRAVNCVPETHDQSPAAREFRRINIQPSTMRELVLHHPKYGPEIVGLAALLLEGETLQRVICSKLRTAEREHDTNVREAISMMVRLGWITKVKDNPEARSSRATLTLTNLGREAMKRDINEFR